MLLFGHHAHHQFCQSMNWPRTVARIQYLHNEKHSLSISISDSKKKKESEITYWIWLTWFPLSSLDWATANDEKKTRGIACGKFRYFLFVLLLCLLFEEWTFGSIIIYEIYVKALNAIRMTARWFRFFFFYFFIILIIIKVLMHAAAAATWSRAYLFPQFFVVVLFTSTEIKWLWILGMR